MRPFLQRPAQPLPGENVTKIRTACLALLGFFLLLPALGHAQSVIDKRQQIMEDNDEANKAIRAALKEKDYATIEAKAKLIGAPIPAA